MANPTVKLATGDRLISDIVVLSGFQRSAPDAGRLTDRLSTALGRIGDNAGWRALPGQVCRSATGGSHPRLVEVHGLGARSRFDARGLAKWLAKALDSSAGAGGPEIMVILPDCEVTREREALRILVQLLVSGYRFDRFKARDRNPTLKVVHLVPPEGEDGNYQRALRQARPIARGVTLARNLGNTPPNEATPSWLAQQAARLAEKWSIDCRILGVETLREMGMGGVLAVGEGSSHAPCLVRLEWGEGGDVISFVGKGVTFDSGGLSIKPSAAMEEMKYDKCGACTVLGIVQALAETRSSGRFRAYLPLVENMPDGASYRPSDIVRCYNGKTVEIVNTDAEGRLILADALAWASEEKPDVIIELSTLTGATVVALGHEGAALYSPDDGLAEELIAAGKSSGEWLWRMPLWPGFAEEMKGIHGDLQNLGSRWGGANNAAAFLGKFMGWTRLWAHFDIAGMAYRTSRHSHESGATGFGVALALDWLLGRSGRY